MDHQDNPPTASTTTSATEPVDARPAAAGPSGTPLPPRLAGDRTEAYFQQ